MGGCHRDGFRVAARYTPNLRWSSFSIRNPPTFSVRRETEEIDLRNQAQEQRKSNMLLRGTSTVRDVCQINNNRVPQ